MTYLFKLARRLAFAHPAAVLAIALVACSEAAPREFLSPDPGSPPPSSTTPVALVVGSAVTALPYDQSIPFRAFGRLNSGDSVGVAVSWSATAGQISADGMYRGTVPGTHRVTAYAVGRPSLMGTATITVSEPGPLFSTLTVHPKPVYIYGGSRVQFGATAMLQSGANTLPSVTWHATGGTIAPNGDFEAGLTAGQFAVIATTLDGLLSDTALVVVEPAALEFLQLSPRVATIPGGGIQDFEVSTIWSDGSTAVPELVWEVPAGTITPVPGSAGPSGGAGDGQTVRFTASTAPGNYKLVAKHQSSGKSDTALVTITPVLQRVELTPETIELLPGATTGFQARGIMSDGAVTSVTVSWLATGGSISGTGVYTAGGQAGVWRVVARTSNGTLADTAVVRIAQPTATLTRIVIAPESGEVAVGEVVDFTARAEWSDGSAALPALTWTAQAGTVTQEGRWTAPATPGSYRVVVRQAGGVLSDTAVYSVVIPPPSLATLTVSPRAPGVAGGDVVNFQAQATWTDGSTTVPPLVWSATGGIVTSTGRWTAPNLSGTFRVSARAPSGLADTAVVTVTEVPWVTAIHLTPRLGALNPGGTLQLTPAVSWSDGQSRPVTLTWTATRGTVSMDGLFTAGSLAGQALVIVGCAGCTAADTATLTITEPVVPAPVVTQLVLSPAALSMGPGEAREVVVTATWSDGSTTLPPLAWTAGGGSVTGFHYIAGDVSGSYQLIVRAAGGTAADTSAVTITGSGTAVTLTGLNLNPSSVTMVPGEQRTLTVGATWSDGTTSVPPLTWTTGGGTLNGLVYTAGTATGSHRVIASHQGGTLADTMLVTIQTGAAATLVSLGVTPATPSVVTGGTLQFTAMGTWSDSSTSVVPVTWTATGGTISGSGLYAAGGAAGTFQVTASHPAAGLSAVTQVTITTSGPGGLVPPELPRVFLTTTYTPPTGRVIPVPAGGNLQAAINSAVCGDEVQLAPGAVFTGTFILPARACSASPIHIRTAGTLPPEGVRVSPAVAASFAKLKTSNVDAALRAAPGARGYRIVALEVTALPTATSNYGLLRIGEANEASIAALPGDVVLDRLYVHGHPTLHVQRCVTLNGVSTAVIDSYLAECHGKGFDAQAIGGWVGPGPFKIVNNFLEGSGENVMFGGAPMRFGVGPADIEIRRNRLFKDPAWVLSKAWTIKNLFELKNARRVLFEANVLENNWADAQIGFAILFQSLNDGAGAGAVPATVQDVTVRFNKILASTSGINILAGVQYAGDGPFIPAARISVTDNLFEDMGRADRPGSPRMMQLLGGLSGLVVSNNTVTATNPVNHLVVLDGGVQSGTVLTNNVFPASNYGVIGNGTGEGLPALNAFIQNWVFERNVVIGRQAAKYPANNYFPTSLPAVLPLGTDGRAVGVNSTQLQQALAGVAP